MHFGVLWIPYTAFFFLEQSAERNEELFSEDDDDEASLRATCAGLAKSTHVPPATVYTYTVRACMYGY